MINNGLSIVPNTNLVTNVGVIGTHSDKRSSAHFFEVATDFKIVIHPTFVIADSCYERRHFTNSINKKRSIITRIINKTVKIAKKIFYRG
jgi:hypothetical protein